MATRQPRFRGLKSPKAPRLRSGVRSPKGWGVPHVVVRGRSYQKFLGTSFSRNNPNATSAEGNFYIQLIKMGLKEGADFIYKANVLGTTVDFLFPASGTAVLIHGATAKNAYSLAQLQTAGLRVVSVESDALIRDPQQTVAGVLREIT